MPTDALAAGDPDEATRARDARSPARTSPIGCACPVDATRSAATRRGKGWVARADAPNKGIKFKEIWVQHRDDSVTKGQVAIYFFPMGSSEKAVIELTDGSETFTRARLRADRPRRAAATARSQTSTTT